MTKAVQIDFLNVVRGGLEDDLELIVVLKPVRIFPISPVGGTPGRLHVGDVPGLGAQHPEKGRGVHRARPHLNIIRLLDDTSPFGEEFFESNDHVLIVHAPPSEQDTQPEAGAAAPGIIGKELLV
jgi:hypothetical protein